MDRNKSAEAFTLIEVMVSLMLITLVTMALYSLSANSSLIYTNTTKSADANQYLTLLMGNQNYGFSSEETTLDRLVEGFVIEDALRQELKGKRVKIVYEELESITMDGFEEQNRTTEPVSQMRESSGAGGGFTIGRTTLHLDESMSATHRLRGL